jgi:transketolase
MVNSINCLDLRKIVLDMAYNGSTVHIACAFSIIEILAVIYRSHLRYSFENQNDPNRDFLILSKGHGVMAQYACMKELGWLKDEDIKNYFSDGTILKGLSDSKVPGLEVSSGSLGHGLSVATGIAYGAALNKSDQKIYVIIGDGEANEGPIWEAIQFAAHHHLSNLMVIVDKNNFQAMGKTEDIIRQDKLHSQIESFDFEVLSINGHDEGAVNDAIQELWNSDENRPKAIIANTIKGKGISFMEDSNYWHYARLDDSLYKKALAEIEASR